MSQPPPDPRRLEEFIAGVARAQPPRRAPATLEARVLQQIARGAARPWWLLGFSGWPWPARLLFLPLAFGFVELAFLVTARATRLWQSLQQSSPLASAQSGLHALDGLVRAGQTLFALATHGVESNWTLGAASLALLLYAALFGLGAAAFRALFLPPASLRY